MIDEIPERDHNPSKVTAGSMSLTRLAILLTLVFVVLLAMLLGSKALDILASKLWPAPVAGVSNSISQNTSSITSGVAQLPVPTTVSTSKPALAQSISSTTSTAKQLPVTVQNNPALLAAQQVAAQQDSNQNATVKLQKNENSVTATAPTSVPIPASGAGQQAPVLSTNNVNASHTLTASTVGPTPSTQASSTVSIPVHPVAPAATAIPVPAQVTNANSVTNQGVAATASASEGNVSHVSNPVAVPAVNPAINKVEPEAKIAETSSNTTANEPVKAGALENSLKNASEAMQKEKEDKLQQKSKVSKKPVKNNEVKQYTAAEKEILKNDPRHYTVQILGMHNKAKLKNFVNDAKLQGKVRYCRGAHQGKPWYVVVYGEYATKDEAQKVLAGLPEEVKKQKPWIRSFASLQGTIHARE